MRRVVILTVAATALAITGSARAVQPNPARASVSSLEVQGNRDSTHFPAISASGRYVGFDSYATNLVPNDTNGSNDVFVRDLIGGTTVRASVASDGTQSNGGDNDGFGPAISADGRLVAFDSVATNLVPGDTNQRMDVFVHVLQTGETTRVSVAAGGEQSDGVSSAPSLSGDGRLVAFESTATNLVPGDTNGKLDLFVHDRLTGETVRASITSDGSQAVGGYGGSQVALSLDGRYVAFDSAATNLAPGDTNGVTDVFVHDLAAGATQRVSVSSAGAQGNWFSGAAAISRDGRLVAFDSGATNLVSGDTNNVDDIFVHDRATGMTARVNLTPAGAQANCVPDGEGGCLGGSYNPSLSANGRFVAFWSDSTNLAARDTNRVSDVFVRDLVARRTTRVSINATGVQGNLWSSEPSVSGDGALIGFYSFASNLVAGDTNDSSDIFVYRRAP